MGNDGFQSFFSKALREIRVTERDLWSFSSVTGEFGIRFLLAQLHTSWVEGLIPY